MQVSIDIDGEVWLFTKRDGQRCRPGRVTSTWLAISTSHSAANHTKPSMISSRRWTASNAPTPASPDLAGPGEPFDLHARVQALFTIKLRQQQIDQDQQAA